MRFWKFLLPLLASTLCLAEQPDRITLPIDSSQMVTLPGHIHRMAQPQYDQGRVDSSFQLGYVTMLFTPSVAQAKALDLLLAQQQDPASANFHKWLTPEQFADRFGMSANDTQKVIAWLKSQGFHIVNVARGRQFVVFSGTEGQIERTFRTEIHRYNVEGETHVANAFMPSIPAALSGIAVGFRGLNDFALKPAVRQHPDYTLSGASTHFLAPGDIATIYNTNPLYTLGFDGTGQKIAIVGQTDVYIDDIDDFRTDFGLSSVSSCAGPGCNTTNLRYIQATAPPGYNAGDLAESDLDLEWSGAVARNAQLIFVTSNLTSGGVVFSAQYAIDNQLAPVISMSYGQCEFYNADPTTGTLSTQDLLFKQAAAEGISFFAASGDDGPAACDINDATQPTHSAVLGLAVSYPASSAYVTGVGGTEFNEGGGTYWSSTNDITNGGSALSYIPEKSWNDFPQLGILDGGGGGPSNCANQSADFSKCVSGFSKPTWQTGMGVPADGVRDVPDVSLSASNYNDPYIVCVPLSEVKKTGSTSTCANGVANALALDNSAFGGTSVSTPLMAGIAALLNQYLSGTSAAGLGNINPMLYELAAKTPSPFHDTPAGSDSIVSCVSGDPVGQPSPLLCPSTGSFGFSTGTGYDLVTGLGSVDADALTRAWSASRAITTTSISTPSSGVDQGASVTFTATVAPSTATGIVSFYNNGSTTALGTASVSNGVATFATTALPSGSNSIFAAYSGDGFNNASKSSAVAVTVTVLFTMMPTPPSLSISAGQSAASTITITPVGGFTGAVSFTNSTASNPGSCTANLPPGALCNFSPGSVSLDGVHSQNVVLTITTAANMALPSGPLPITITGTSGNSTSTTTVNLTLTSTTESFILKTNAQVFGVAVGGFAQIPINVNSSNGFIVGSGSSATTSLALTYTCSGIPPTAEISCQLPNNGQPTNATSVTVTLATTPVTTQLRPLGGTRIFYALLLPGMFGIVFSGGSRTRGLRLLGLIVVLGLFTVWLGACGGSNNTLKNTGTPPGIYTVTVNATTGTRSGGTALASSVMFTLNVTAQ